MADTRLGNFVGGLVNGAILGAIIGGAVDGVDGAKTGAMIGAGINGTLNALLLGEYKRTQLRKFLNDLFSYKGLSKDEKKVATEIAMNRYENHVRSDSKNETKNAEIITIIEQIELSDIKVNKPADIDENMFSL